MYMDHRLFYGLYNIIQYTLQAQSIAVQLHIIITWETAKIAPLRAKSPVCQLNVIVYPIMVLLTSISSGSCYKGRMWGPLDYTQW